MDPRVLKALIVDDEPIARRVLREDLEQLSDVEVLGEASDGKQALLQIEKLKPDVVFLDLQMPVMSGFEVVRNLSGKHAPVVVIVTAFDQHAIEAFEAGAVDYLLKPVNETRLRTAVERARSMQGRSFGNRQPGGQDRRRQRRAPVYPSAQSSGPERRGLLPAGRR